MSFLGLKIPSAFCQVNHKQIQQPIMHCHLHIHKFYLSNYMSFFTKNIYIMLRVSYSHTHVSYWFGLVGYILFVCLRDL